jgi:hypothetical protein
MNAVNRRTIEDLRTEAADLYWVCFVLSGLQQLSIEIAADVVAQDYPNGFFSEWMHGWSRRIALAKALEAIRQELAESARRTGLARGEELSALPALSVSEGISRPASQVVAQYYNLIRLGKAGYRAIHQACQDVAVNLARQVGEIGPFELLSGGQDLPVIAWTLKGATHWSLYDLADRLRDRGWQVPAYRMPFNRQDLVVQRVVVRNGFTHDLAEMLLRDIRRHLDWFATQPGLKPTVDGAGFHH